MVKLYVPLGSGGVIVFVIAGNTISPSSCSSSGNPDSSSSGNPVRFWTESPDLNMEKESKEYKTQREKYNIPVSS